MTHEQLIAQCVQWFWNEFPSERRMLYAVNNNSTDRIEGNRNKAKGVVRGVFDLCYILKEQTAYLDAKIGKDTLSKEQFDFKEKAELRGCICLTFSSFEEFKNIIKYLQETYNGIR